MRVSSAVWLVLAVVPACTLTHSLDDLRGGVAAGGITAGSAANAGSDSGGSGGNAGKGGDTSLGGAEASAGAGGTEPQTGPELISTSFSEEHETQGFLEEFQLQFNEEMDLATLAGDGLCKGSLQLAKLGEQLCVPLGVVTAVEDENGDPVAGRYRVLPTEPLEVGARYELVVTTNAKTTAGVPLVTAGKFEAVAVYRHSVAIDGTNDFLPGEKLTTTTAGYSAYVAWDRAALYLGMTGAQIQEADTSVFLLAYLGWPGAESRTNVGQTYKAVTPQLSFDASHYARWQGNNQGATVTQYTPDMTWDEAPLESVGGGRNRKDNFVELKLPFEAFSGTLPLAEEVVPFAMFLLRETMGAEDTFAAAPQVSGGNSTTPYLAKHYDFSLTESKMFPNQYPVR